MVLGWANSRKGTRWCLSSWLCLTWLWWLKQMNCRCEGRRVCGREDGRFGLAADFLASSGGRRRSLLDLVALQGCAVCHRTPLGTHWKRCCAGGDCSALHGGHPVALTALDSSTAAYLSHHSASGSIHFLGTPLQTHGPYRVERRPPVLAALSPSPRRCRALPPCSGSPPETHLGAATDAHLTMLKAPPRPLHLGGRYSKLPRAITMGRRRGAVAPSARRPEGHTRGTQRSHRPPTCCHCLANLRVDVQAVPPSS